VVGFIGDGVNDAPALRAADVGIAVHDALPVAQEAADVVMLERGLGVLDAAVLEGRRAHANLLKYLRMALSSNFGNVLSVVLASLFLPFLPMLPLQLLVQNLLYDLSQLALPWDRVDEELLAQPVRLEAPRLGRFMGVFGPVSTVFDLLAFAALWWLFGLSSPAHAAAFHGAWFAWGLLSQTLVVHLIRTPRLPFVQSQPAPVLLAATLAVAGLALWLPWGPWAAAIGLQAPPSGWGAFLAGLLLAYGLAVGAAKAIYLRRFGWQ
jgi:Mg2+-importing ATPase